MLDAQNKSRTVYLRDSLEDAPHSQQFELGLNQFIRPGGRVWNIIFEGNLAFCISVLFQENVPGDCEKVCLESLGADSGVLRPGADEGLRSDVLCLKAVSCKPKDETVYFGRVGFV